MQAQSGHMVVETSQVITNGEQRLLKGYAAELGKHAGCEGLVTFIEDASIPMLMVLFTLAIDEEPINLASILVTNIDGGAQVCNIRGADGQRLMEVDLFPNVIAALEALNPILRSIAAKVRQTQRPTLGERVRRFFA
jgi:hypothetical protein